MTDLANFLRARIAEDEGLAHTAAEQNWAWRTTSGVVVADRSTFPARVLAECEAKQRIVAEAMDIEGQLPDDEWDSGRIAGEEAAWMTALKILALPYSDHPDFDPSWRV